MTIEGEAGFWWPSILILLGKKARNWRWVWFWKI